MSDGYPINFLVRERCGCVRSLGGLWVSRPLTEHIAELLNYGRPDPRWLRGELSFEVISPDTFRRLVSYDNPTLCPPHAVARLAEEAERVIDGTPHTEELRKAMRLAGIPPADERESKKKRA